MTHYLSFLGFGLPDVYVFFMALFLLYLLLDFFNVKLSSILAFFMSLRRFHVKTKVQAPVDQEATAEERPQHKFKRVR